MQAVRARSAMCFVQKHSTLRACHRERKVQREGKSTEAVESFLFRKATHRRVRPGSSMPGVCCRTVISNGSYGHLNNHLARPPSLDSHYFFSPSRLFLCFFSQNLGAIGGARSDDSRKTTALTLAFRFFFYRYQLAEGFNIIRHRRESRVAYDEIHREIPIEGRRSSRSR